MHDPQTIFEQGREGQVGGQSEGCPPELEEGSDSLKKIEGRFWSKAIRTEIDECWIWIAGKLGAGYGNFAFRGTGCPAHRFSWMLFNKKEIPSGMLVMHTCDNPPCVNPKHLVLGTTADNIADKCSKGRQRKGDNHPARVNPNFLKRGDDHHYSKLTSEQVLEIRALKGKMKNVSIAKKFKVTDGTISMIMKRKIWAHLP